ncbi:putative adhesin [Lentzea sp. NPDC051208]|uniref:putative adhesin n=1 Tax=Lentzea sp. NPDC051208 TaxID=3154642 RepID=UPI00342BC0CD
MPLYVFAHGEESPGSGKIRVPRGLTVHFYARSGEQAATANLLKVLTGAVTGAFDSYRYPRKMPNYRLTPHRDDVLAAAVQVASSPDDVMTVQRAIHLCEATPERPCVQRHICTGLFGDIQSGRIRFAADLHVLACRQARGPAPKMTMTLPGEKSPEFLEHLMRTAREVLALAAVDQAAAGSFFDRLDDDVQALLLNVSDSVKNWSYIREATRYLHAVKPLGFLHFWLRQSRETQELLSSDPELSAAVRDAENFVTVCSHLEGFQAEAVLSELSPEDHDNLQHCLALQGQRTLIDASSLAQKATRRNVEVMAAADAQNISFSQIGPVVAIGDGHDFHLIEQMHDPMRRTALKTGSLFVDGDGVLARYDEPAFDTDRARTLFTEAIRQACNKTVRWS